MLARRLIPCLDVAGGRVVKGVHFRELRDAGDPVDQAARYDAAGADEVVLLDIGASHEERGTLIDLVSRVADRLFVPFTVGGGIRSVAAGEGGRGGERRRGGGVGAGGGGGGGGAGGARAHRVRGRALGATAARARSGGDPADLDG